MTVSSPPLLDHFEALANRYDVALCDVWGVVHNGVVVFAEACEALIRFREGGGTVILLTNAPRPNDVVVAFLDTLKTPRAAYDAVVTSGDVARAVMEARPLDSVFHIGPGRDHPTFQELGTVLAPPQEADYVVCSGLYDDTTETPEDYRDLLALLKARNLMMLCANPDLVVERGHELIYCAGAIAHLYETMGGEVLYTGKPHRPVYDAALQRASGLRGGAEILPARVLAIGDAVRTDLRGAADFGVDSLFVTGGIHAAELGGKQTLDMAALDAMFAEAEVRPLAVMQRLRW